MDQRGGEYISQDRIKQKNIRIMVRSPAVQNSMDLEVSCAVSLEELRLVISEWMSEHTNGRYVNTKHSLLVRKCNGEIMHGERTLEEIGVSTNELFYLF